MEEITGIVLLGKDGKVISEMKVGCAIIAAIVVDEDKGMEVDTIISSCPTHAYSMIKKLQDHAIEVDPMVNAFKKAMGARPKG